MSDANMKNATMILSTRYLNWLGWHGAASGLQKLAAQEQHDNNCQEEVNGGEDNERRGQSRHRCYRFASPHHAINYPWLASQFRDHPSGFNRQKSQRPGGN